MCRSTLILDSIFTFFLRVLPNSSRPSLSVIAGFSTTSRAPLESASKVVYLSSLSMATVTMRMGVGRSDMTHSVTSSPSFLGILRSSSTTSGLKVPIFSIASSPSLASPMTSIRGSSSSSFLSIFLVRMESSTIRTRQVVGTSAGVLRGLCPVSGSTLALAIRFSGTWAACTLSPRLQKYSP